MNDSERALNVARISASWPWQWVGSES